MKIKYLTDIRDYIKNFPQFDVIEYDEIPSLLSKGYSEISLSSVINVSVNLTIEDFSSLKAIIICDLTVCEDSCFSTDVFNIYAFIVNWLGIPVVAFPMLFFDKKMPNDFDIPFAEFEDMEKVLDTLDLQEEDEILVLASYMNNLSQLIQKFLKKLREYHVNRFAK